MSVKRYDSRTRPNKNTFFINIFTYFINNYICVGSGKVMLATSGQLSMNPPPITSSAPSTSRLKPSSSSSNNNIYGSFHQRRNRKRPRHSAAKISDYFHSQQGQQKIFNGGQIEMQNHKMDPDDEEIFEFEEDELFCRIIMKVFLNFE